MTPRITSYVPQAIKAVTAGTEKALLETAVKVTAQAKALSPVDQGELKGSLMWKSSTSAGGNSGGASLAETVNGSSAIVGTAVEHGIYQEYGTRYMAAQPYLRPAVDIVTNGSTFNLAIAKAMNDTVRVKLASIPAGFVG